MSKRYMLAASSILASVALAGCSTGVSDNVPVADQVLESETMEQSEEGAVALSLAQDRAVMRGDMRAAYEMLEPSCRASLEYERFASVLRATQAIAFDSFGVELSESARFEMTNAQAIEFSGIEAFITSDVTLDGAPAHRQTPEFADRFVYLAGRWWGVCDSFSALIE